LLILAALPKGAVTITLDLTPDVESELLKQAQAVGLPIERFLARHLELLMRKNSQPQRPTGCEDILANLRTFEPELREAGIGHLFLHGSYVRSTETEISDVDIESVLGQCPSGRQTGRNLGYGDADYMALRARDLTPARTPKETNSGQAVTFQNNNSLVTVEVGVRDAGGPVGS